MGRFDQTEFSFPMNKFVNCWKEFLDILDADYNLRHSIFQATLIR